MTDLLVEMSVALAAREWPRLRKIMASPALTPVAVEEVLLQSYLLLGFPSAMQGFAEWRSLRPVSETGEADAVAAPWNSDSAEWIRRGEELCRVVYEDNYDQLRRNVKRLHPELDGWMIMEGYGKVLAREGLNLWQRELCTVGILAVTAWEEQLHSHLRGALHAGARPDAVGRALETGLATSDKKEWKAVARGLWDRVLTRHESADSSLQ